MLFSFFQCKLHWGKLKFSPNFVRNESGLLAAALQEQINELSPTEKVTDTSDVPEYNERITLLRYAPERYTNFDSDEDIPEQLSKPLLKK